MFNNKFMEITLPVHYGSAGKTRVNKGSTESNLPLNHKILQIYTPT